MSFNTSMHSWAQLNYSGMGINEVWGKDLAAVNKALRMNVDVNFHPVGCNTVKSLIDHEFAHQLDELLGIKKLAPVISLDDDALNETRA